MAQAKISAELEEARARMYEKKDMSRIVKAIGILIGMALLLVAFLNLVNVLNLSFKPLQLSDTNGDRVIDRSDNNVGYDVNGDGVPDQSEAPLRRFLNFLVFSLLAFIGPYGFYMAGQQRNIKAIEKRLPDFLRDVAEAGRFGMTLAEATVVASSGRYGKLSPEIKKMAAQIDWGVPATEALKLFAERVKTPTVERVVSVIIKASDAGGHVADVLTMVSHDAKEVQLTEEERRIAMGTYIAVIYIAFLVFLVTIFILNATFLPKIREAAAGIAGTNEAALAASPLPSDIAGVIFSIQLAFFIAAMVHAIGDGILAGVLDSGKIANGLRHSFFMLVITIVGFQLI